MSMKSIKIVNPSEEPLMISLFLSSDPLNKALEQAVKSSNKSDEDTFDVTTRPLLGKETYFGIFCGNKIKEVEANKTLQ